MRQKDRHISEKKLCTLELKKEFSTNIFLWLHRTHFQYFNVSDKTFERPSDAGFESRNHYLLHIHIEVNNRVRPCVYNIMAHHKGLKEGWRKGETRYYKTTTKLHMPENITIQASKHMQICKKCEIMWLLKTLLYVIEMNIWMMLKRTWNQKLYSNFNYKKSTTLHLPANATIQAKKRLRKIIS